MKKNGIVVEYVCWLDPFVSSGWRPIEELQRDNQSDDGIVSHSVGYLVHESKKCVKLCLNWSESGMASDIQVISKKFIVRRKKVGIIQV